MVEVVLTHSHILSYTCATLTPLLQLPSHSVIIRVATMTFTRVTAAQVGPDTVARDTL